MPQLVIRGDDLGGVHQARRNIGDVALESHQGAGSGQGRLIEDLVSFVGGDEARALRTSLAGDDGPGPVGLGVQGPVVPGRALLGVGPHRPPRPRMGDRVPHRLSPEALVPLAPGASPGGDGVNQLPISERVTLPVEVRLKVPRGPGGAGPDDEPQVRLVQGLEVGRREHAGISHDDELLNTVGGLEGLHHGDDRGGLGPVALPATDSQGEAGPVDQ